MALHLVLSRQSGESFNLSRISCSSESEQWSTTYLYPQFPKKINGKYAHSVECSGDGLLCFCIVDVIWNPKTDKFQLIPDADSNNLPCVCSNAICNFRRDVISLASGLGFVAESDDYKYVSFISNFDHSWSRHVAVYSSRTNSWKELPFPFHFDDICPDEVSTCVNGFLYWKNSAGVNVIISFDLSSDKFSTILCPDEVPRGFGLYSCLDYDVHLLEFDGSLCLVIEFDKRATRKLLSFWVYAASSTPSSPWTRKTSLDVRLDARAVGIPLWLGKKNNGGSPQKTRKKKKNNGGEFLMLQGRDGALLEYDYTTRELKRIDQMHYHRRDILTISPYVETKNKINSTCEFGGWTSHLRPHSKNGNGNIVDRISQLSDDLILCILSFLSLKEAASTRVLSTRWSDLWRHTSHLNFHHANVKIGVSEYIRWVNSVVESHKALSLKEFSISLPIDYSTRSTVIKWLEFAFSRRVEVLELNLFGRRFAFLQKFLRKSPILKSANLRSLCLKCLKVSGRGIGLFLRNCPLLERLIIKSVVFKSDLEVCGSALKHLDIQYCKGGISIKGYAPNLTSLKIDSSPFSLEDEDDVDYVDRHIHLAWAARQSADEPPLFPFISSQLTTLQFTLHFPPKGYFGNRFPEVPTLRELIVTYLGGHGIRPITSLICAFPCLEEFEIKCFRRIDDHTRSHIEQQGMDDVNNVERLCHCRLRVFKFSRFDVDDGNHANLMSYILDNCIALQKIILDIYGVDSPSYVAAGKYVEQLQSKLPTHIQLIVSFNNRQLV